MLDSTSIRFLPRSRAEVKDGGGDHQQSGNSYGSGAAGGFEFHNDVTRGPLFGQDQLHAAVRRFQPPKGLEVGGQRALPVDDDENLCVLDLVAAEAFQLFTPDDRFKVGNPVLRVRDDKSQIFLDHRIGTGRSIPLHRLQQTHWSRAKPSSPDGNSSTRSPSTLM